MSTAAFSAIEKPPVKRERTNQAISVHVSNLTKIRISQFQKGMGKEVNARNRRITWSRTLNIRTLKMYPTNSLEIWVWEITVQWMKFATSSTIRPLRESPFAAPQQ